MDILLCHYNYVINPKIRKETNTNVKNAIIVFDEAHNIENVAEESCSFSLKEEDLDFTIFMAGK